MFTRFIEERSFVSDKDVSLAFFDECTERVDAAGESAEHLLLEVCIYEHIVFVATVFRLCSVVEPTWDVVTNITVCFSNDYLRRNNGFEIKCSFLLTKISEFVL